MKARERQISFLTILFSEFIDYVGISMVYPLFAFMLFDPAYHFLPEDSSLQARGIWLGILIALHPFMQFFFAPFFGSLSDRLGRKKLLCNAIRLGLVGYALAFFAIIFQNMLLLVFYRIFSGTAAGSCSIVSAVIADLSTVENKVKNYGFLNMAFGIGFTLGPFLSGLSAHYIHLCAPFAIAFGLVAINWWLVRWGLTESLPQPRVTQRLQTPFTLIKRAVLMPEVRSIFLSLLIFSLGWSLFTEFASLFLIERYSFNSRLVGFYYGYTGFFYAISAGFLIFPLMTFLKIERSLLLSMFFSGLYLCLFVLIENPNLLWIYLPLCQFSFAFVYPSICAVISNRVSEARQGEAMGIYQAIIALALAITPFCSGLFVGNHPNLIILISGLLMILAACVTVILRALREKGAVIDLE